MTRAETSLGCTRTGVAKLFYLLNHPRLFMKVRTIPRPVGRYSARHSQLVKLILLQNSEGLITLPLQFSSDQTSSKRLWMFIEYWKALQYFQNEAHYQTAAPQRKCCLHSQRKRLQPDQSAGSARF